MSNQYLYKFMCLPPSYITSLPPHGINSVQSLVWLVSLVSLQFLPPYCGAGFEQEMLRVCVPLPHVAEQALHSLHSDQSPSTVNQQNIKSVLSVFIVPK